MARAITRALLTVVLLLVGAALWQAGQFEQRAATALRHVSELGFGDAISEYDELEQSAGMIARMPGVGTDLLGRIRAERAIAQYWSADYAAIQPPQDPSGTLQGVDPTLLFAAANAAYRGTTSAQRNTDTVMKAYAEVLKASPGHPDAAYNYEFLARKRAASAASPTRRGGPADAGAVPPPTSIHGVQGAPPKGADMGQFRIVIPKRGEERKEDPEAGSGKARVRRG